MLAGMHGRFMGAACAFTVAAAAGLAQKPDAGAAGARTEALDAAVRAAAPDHWGAVLVAVDAEVVFERGYGMRDRREAPIDGSSLFDLGCLTDRVTAIAALQLLAAKKWGLDDPVARALGGDWPKDKAQVTWRHVLQHTSGLPADADWSGGRAGARRTALGAIAATRLVDAPGRAFHWSPLNSALLALLVETVGGADHAEVVRRRVLVPAGMTGAAFAGDRRVDHDRMTWRTLPDGRTEPASALEVDWSSRGARGLLAGASDLGALASGLCGKLLPAEPMAALLQPLPGGDALRVQAVVRGGVEWTQMHGAVTGYRARLLLHRPSRSWIVLLAGERDLDALETALATVVAPMLPGAGAGKAPAPVAVPAPVPAPAPQAPVVSEDELRRFCGAFALPSGGQFEVRREGGELRVDGVGLIASARLVFGCWPVPKHDAALRAAEDRGMAGLVPLLAGEPAPDGVFGGDAVKAAAAKLLGEIAARPGGPRKLEFVGTEVAGGTKSWLRAVGERDAVYLRVTWSGSGRISAVAEAPAPGAFQRRFRVERADWAVGNWSVGTGAAMTLSVEGRGAGRVLVLEDQGGITEGLWCKELR
jgi:CubicO group peptidase (beta-lactamase class C family)